MRPKSKQVVLQRPCRVGQSSLKMFYKNKTLVAIAIALVINLSLVSGQNQQHVATNVSTSTANNGLHHVVVGDNFWDLAFQAYGTGYAWVKILELNPIMPGGKPRKAWVDSNTGYWKCDVIPGELLFLDEDFWSLKEKDEAEATPTANPPARNDENFEPISIPAQIPRHSTLSSGLIAFFVVMFIATLILIVYLFVAGKRWQNSDVVSSGPPQIKDGIQDNDVARMLSSRHHADILSIKKGKLHGKGIPSYNFSVLSPNRFLNNLFGKRFNGEVGYEALARMPNGQEETVYCLQGCGNDVREGNFVRGLTFIPDASQSKEIEKQDTNLKKEEVARHVDVPEKQGPSTEESDFNLEKGILGIISQGVKDGKEFFFDIQMSGGSKFRFDSTPDKKGVKSN